MELIKCSECGTKISVTTNSCPNCGCPIEEIEDYKYLLNEKEAIFKEDYYEEHKKDENRRGLTFIIFIIIVTIILLLLL